MAKRKKKVDPLPVIWEVSDELWRLIQEILDELDPPTGIGRERIDQRQALNGIIYQMRSGCQWNYLPKKFGDDSSIHRTMQRWIAKDVFKRIWAVLIENCDGLGGVDWEWQSVDAAMGKARFGGIKSGQTPRIAANLVPKRSLIVEGDGGPTGVVLAGANVNDQKLLKATIEAVVVDRPKPTPNTPQHLCLDKGYDNPTGHAVAKEKHYTPHIRRIGEEKLDTRGRKRHPARRWVVERTLGWLNKCRAILVRYAKKSTNYMGIVQLASALLWYRRHHRLSLLR